MKNSYYDDYEAAQVILKYEKELEDAKQNLSLLGRQKLFDEFTRELRRFTKNQYKDNLTSIPFDYIVLNQDTDYIKNKGIYYDYKAEQDNRLEHLA